MVATTFGSVLMKQLFVTCRPNEKPPDKLPVCLKRAFIATSTPL